jgi:hypothetical protein
VADDDGVCVVRQADVDAVLAKTRRRVADEEGKRARYEAGELSLDVNGMRERLREKGLKYIGPDSLAPAAVRVCDAGGEVTVPGAGFEPCHLTVSSVHPPRSAWASAMPGEAALFELPGFYDDVQQNEKCKSLFMRLQLGQRLAECCHILLSEPHACDFRHQCVGREKRQALRYSDATRRQQWIGERTGADCWKDD